MADEVAIECAECGETRAADPGEMSVISCDCRAAPSEVLRLRELLPGTWRVVEARAAA